MVNSDCCVYLALLYCGQFMCRFSVLNCVHFGRMNFFLQVSRALFPWVYGRKFAGAITSKVVGATTSSAVGVALLVS